MNATARANWNQWKQVEAELAESRVQVADLTARLGEALLALKWSPAAERILSIPSNRALLESLREGQ